MWPISPEFTQGILGPQTITIRADVSKAGRRLYSDLPVTGGEIIVEDGQYVVSRRTCTVTVNPRLPTGTYTDIPALPTTPADPLAHYGQELSLRWGLIYPNGVTEWVPVGVYRINGTSGSLLGETEVVITGASREADLYDDRFPTPRTVSGPSAVQVITDLIHETLPDAQVVPATSRDRRVPRTIFDRERLDAIRTLAKGIGAVVYADAAGRFVIRDAPTLATPPVWTISKGKNLTRADQTSSREQVYNDVVCIGENPSSGDEPVIGRASDSNPTSPTYYAPASQGGYGRVTKFMYIPTVTTRRQAAAAAAAELARCVGAASRVDLSSIPNVALEALDVVDIWTDPEDVNSIRRHVVDRLRFALAPGGAFGVESRDLGQAVAAW